MEGWVSIHRKITEHWTYKERRVFSKFEAWIDLILMANHKDNRFPLGNEIIEVKRGDVVTSEIKLMERWGWGKSKTRSFLDLLEQDGMIVKKSDRKKTTISLMKYGDFQDQQTTDRLPADREQTASRPPADTINNVNNANNLLPTTAAGPNPFRLFETEGFGTISSIIADKINDFIDTYGERWVCEAMKEAVFYGKRGLPYVGSILERYRISGVDEPWLMEKVKQFPKGGQANAKHGTGHAGRTDAQLNELSL